LIFLLTKNKGNDEYPVGENISIDHKPDDDLEQMRIEDGFLNFFFKKGSKPIYS